MCTVVVAYSLRLARQQGMILVEDCEIAQKNATHAPLEIV